mgnify:CR=1 FL=1
MKQLCKYPQYNANEIFETNLDEIINLIKKIRTLKLENNIGNDYKLVFNGSIPKEISIVSKMLKIDDENILKNFEVMFDITIKYMVK